MNDSPFLTIKELSAYFQIHEMTTYRLVKTGQIRSIKVGGQIRIPRFVIEEMENKND